MRQPIARMAIASLILVAGALLTPASAQQDAGEKAYGDLLSRMLPGASGTGDIFEIVGMSPEELGERAMRCYWLDGRFRVARPLEDDNPELSAKVLEQIQSRDRAAGDGGTVLVIDWNGGILGTPYRSIISVVARQRDSGVELYTHVSKSEIPPLADCWSDDRWVSLDQFGK